MANSESESIQTIIDIAVETYRRQWFLEHANRVFAILEANSDAWNEEIEERTQWDTALQDGLRAMSNGENNPCAEKPGSQQCLNKLILSLLAAHINKA